MKVNRFHRGKKGTILGGKGPAFGQAINIPKVAPRESLEVYWHPNRAGVEPAPEDFARRLTEMHPDLRCCRPPTHAPLGKAPAWILWYRRDRITHPLSPGHMMLFAWRNPHTGEPEPLDERVFAVLYASSALKWGTGANYFKRCIEQRMADEKASRERAYENHRKAKQRELLRSRRITTAGTGSKFARHHDGTLQPSRGQLNWHVENRRRILPPEQIKAEDEAREQQRARASDVRKQIRADLGIRV